VDFAQGAHSNLPGDVRAHARLPGAADNGFVDVAGFDAGALKRRANRRYA
jgi:hypothetical protein